MVKGVLYIFFFLIVGELIVYLLDLPIAGNIVGMILIFLALKLKWIKLKDVKPASDKLIQYMILFFVPYGVGLMVFYDMIKAHWFAITVSVLVSTILTLYVTAFVQQKLSKDA